MVLQCLRIPNKVEIFFPNDFVDKIDQREKSFIESTKANLIKLSLRWSNCVAHSIVQGLQLL